MLFMYAQLICVDSKMTECFVLNLSRKPQDLPNYYRRPDLNRIFVTFEQTLFMKQGQKLISLNDTLFL